MHLLKSFTQNALQSMLKSGLVGTIYNICTCLLKAIEIMCVKKGPLEICNSGDN